MTATTTTTRRNGTSDNLSRFLAGATHLPVSVVVLCFWLALVALAWCCDGSVRKAISEGQRIDRVQDAIGRVARDVADLRCFPGF